MVAYSALTGRGIATAGLLALVTGVLQAQAVYELDDDGSLRPGSRIDVVVRDPTGSEPVFYTLGSDGTLSGTDRPRSVAQQPGAEIELRTGPGRRLEVARQIVNVREGPGIGNPVITQLERGSQVIAIEYRRAWVRVGDPRTESPVGWVYEPLMTEVFGYSPPPAYTPVARFQRALEKLWQPESPAGLFNGLDGAELTSRGVVALTASESWFAFQAMDRWQAANLLGRTWRELVPARDVAVLNIHNSEGRREMTVIKP